MREVFNLPRTGVYWWGFFTATVFLIPAAWQRGVANFLRTVDWFQPDRIPFTWFYNLGTWIDTVVKRGTGQIRFDPKQALVYIGPFGIANLIIALILGILLILVAFISYRKAVAKRGFVDDLFAMVVIYIVFRVVGVAAEALQVPVIDFFHREEPRSYLAVLTIFMAFLLIGGKGAQDSKVFFKVLFEGFLIWFLIVPQPTVLALAFLIEIPAMINHWLISTQAIQPYYTMIVSVWGLLGVFLVGIYLYSAGQPPPPPPRPVGGLTALRRLLRRAEEEEEG